MKNKTTNEEIKEKVLKKYYELDDITFDRLANENGLSDFLIDLTIQEKDKEFNNKLEQLKKDIDLEANDILSDSKIQTAPIFDLLSRVNKKIVELRK